MIMARQTLIEKQNRICLKLIEEIHRIRSIVNSISFSDMQDILEIVQMAAFSTEDNDLLISTSQLLQTAADSSIVDHIMSLGSNEAEISVYYELLVSDSFG